MKQTINEYQFRDAFIRMDRKENFSYAGLIALYDYLTALEDDIGEEFELDVIALCCDYSEYDLEDLQREFGDYEGVQWEDMEQAIEWLEDRTTVIRVDDDDRVIVQVF